MPATLAPSPWSAPAAPNRDDGWRFARRLEVPGAWRFDLRRNVSITPRHLLLSYLLLCAISLTVAGGFWWFGVSVVGFFAGLELLGLGLALLVVARHAGDREVLTVSGRDLLVEQCVGPEVLRASFRSAWVRVEPAGGEGSLLELSGEGRRVLIGRHVRPEFRAELAQELRRVLRLGRVAQEQFVIQEQEA